MPILSEQIDMHIMESDLPTVDRDDFMAIICDTLNTKMEQTWRVRFYDDGSVGLHSFALPAHQKNLDAGDRLNNVSLLPTWVKERLAVLQICQQGDILNGIGQKVSDRVFYVIE